jgi:hypothetical protein
VLRDGRRIEADARTFRGMPGDELSAQEERERFEWLCAALGTELARALHGRFMTLESQARFPEAGPRNA